MGADRGQTGQDRPQAGLRVGSLGLPIPAGLDPWAALFIAAISLMMGAFLRGDVLVRPLYDEQVRMREQADTQAERNTDAVVKLTSALDRLTAVSEERDRIVEKALDGLADDMAALLDRPRGRSRER